MWRELEATSDVFMPKTQLMKILNSHAAQIDGIIARLPKPVEMQMKRVWDEDLQTFVEMSVPVTQETHPAATVLNTQVINKKNLGGGKRKKWRWV